jgi:hypothetical protein
VIHFNRQEAIEERRAPDEVLQASLKRMSRLQLRSKRLTRIRSWGDESPHKKVTSSKPPWWPLSPLLGRFGCPSPTLPCALPVGPGPDSPRGFDAFSGSRHTPRPPNPAGAHRHGPVDASRAGPSATRPSRRPPSTSRRQRERESCYGLYVQHKALVLNAQATSFRQ